MSLGTILLIVLILMLLGVLPTWGYSSKMGLWAHRWCWTARVDTGDFASDGQDIARHIKSTFPLIIAVVLLCGGCGKKDDPRSVASPVPAVKPDDSKPVVPPPSPRVDAAKGAEVQSPQPGQANDHSSPAFKGGGMPDKKK